MSEELTETRHKRLLGLNEPLMMLANFVELINQVWKTGTLQGLRIFAVNRSYEQVQYDQAVWFDLDGKSPKVKAISNVALIDSRSSLVSWLQKMVKEAEKFDGAKKISRLYKQYFSEKTAEDWSEHNWGHALWIPLFYPEGELRAVMVLSRKRPDFQPRDLALMERLAQAYAQHYVLLTGGGKAKKRLLPTTRNTIIGLIIFAALSLFIPVRQSALAPMEIRPKSPHIVSSPLNAAIEDIFVDPNAKVTAGQSLLKFNDAEIKSDYRHAEKSLEVTRERLRTATQGSFQDERAKSELRLIKAQLEKDRVVRDFKKQLHDYIELKAPVSGLLLYSGKNEWMGKPVSIGERIMLIADEKNVEIEAELAVTDDMEIKPDAEVRVFLNSTPLKPLAAVLRTINLTPTRSSADVVSFKLIADLAPGEKIPRIGSKGTVKVYGGKVPLGLFLFKKPLSALRQMTGL